ncbi:MAG TPA: hypothetical protein VHT21_24705 [Stellaceae bacterium]|nr:hypothetical protein [Stellaceae bacterium]
MIENLTRAEYDALLRQDFGTFTARCFHDLNPQAELAMSWHLDVIAAKLTAVREGRIRRLIINMSHPIDLIESIFHPTRCRRPTASLDGSWVDEQRRQRRRSAMNDLVEAAIARTRWRAMKSDAQRARAPPAPLDNAESRPAALAWKPYRRSHARTTRLLDRQECRTFLIARNTDHSNT